MTRLCLALLLAFGAGQPLLSAVPFTYCFVDGELCCEGWAAQACCDEEPGAGTTVGTYVPECSSLSVARDGITVARETQLAQPDANPALALFPLASTSGWVPRPWTWTTSLPPNAASPPLLDTVILQL